MSVSPPSYQVSLPLFEGPLDLLLHLIEKQELDITHISLAQVTGQYLEYVAQLQERDPDSLAAFLVVAAKLLVIKSRVLLPPPPGAVLPDAEEEEGEDLVRALIEYRRFKEAGRWLHQVQAEGLRVYVRMAAAPDLERTLDLEGVTLESLTAALRELLEIKPAGPPLNGTLTPVLITVAQQMELIERRLRRGRPVSFLRLLKGAPTRIALVVTLLAVLELVKQRRARMAQDKPFGDIRITAVESGARHGATGDEAHHGGWEDTAGAE